MRRLVFCKCSYAGETGLKVGGYQSCVYDARSRDYCSLLSVNYR